MMLTKDQAAALAHGSVVMPWGVGRWITPHTKGPAGFNATIAEGGVTEWHCLTNAGAVGCSLLSTPSLADAPPGQYSDKDGDMWGRRADGWLRCLSNEHDTYERVDDVSGLGPFTWCGPLETATPTIVTVNINAPAGDPVGHTLGSWEVAYLPAEDAWTGTPEDEWHEWLAGPSTGPEVWLVEPADVVEASKRPGWWGDEV